MKGFSHYTSESWSAKYKRSIDCSHPKGFSQRAHCQGKRKQGVDESARLTPRRKEVLGAIGRAAQDTIERGIPDNKREAALHRRQRVRNAVDAAITAQGYGKSAGERATRKRVVGRKLALSRIDRKMEKHYGERAAAAGENKRGYETRWRKKHMVEGTTRHSPRTGRNSTERERLASKLTAFMETVGARATRLHNTPVTTAWVLAERPKVTSSGYGGAGKHPYHAFVPDATDSEYMYHFKGHYWWSANNSGWWIQSSTRIAIRDARQQWDGLEGGAVATGEWRDGSVTLIRPK